MAAVEDVDLEVADGQRAAGLDHLAGGDQAIALGRGQQVDLELDRQHRASAGSSVNPA